MLPVFRQPWFITEPALRVVLAVASRDQVFADERVRALEALEGKPLTNTRSVSVRDGVAKIPVAGPLVRHASMFDEISGATSYAAIRKDFQAAIDDPSVDAIVFEIDSPGGEVTGLAELADAIYAARGRKTIKAYVDGMACSAAFWLAAACSEVVISKTAELGSIGCVLAFLDDSQAMEQAGLKTVKFVSSQSPLKHIDPSSSAGAEEYQRLVDTLAGVFVESVAQYRGITGKQVLERYGRGGVMVGEDAVAAGLADRVDDYESLVQSLVSERKGTRMQSRYAAALGMSETATEEQIANRVQALAEFESFAMEQFKASNAAEARGAVIAAAEALRELPALRKEREELEGERIRTGVAAALQQGFSDRKISLGWMQTEMPFLVAEERRAGLFAGFEKLESVTLEGVLGVVATVALTRAELSTIEGYVARKAPSIAEAPKAPARTDKADADDLEREENEFEKKIKRAIARGRAVK